MDEPIDLIGFMQAVIDRSYRWVKDACDGLDEDQLRYQPTPESNSIAWLLYSPVGTVVRTRRCLWTRITGAMRRGPEPPEYRRVTHESP